MNQHNYRNYPKGSATLLYEDLRLGLDQGGLVCGRVTRGEWAAKMVDVFGWYAFDLGLKDNAHCSLDYLLYRVLKHCVEDLHGTKYWDVWDRNRRIPEPEFQATRPGFIMADWHKSNWHRDNIAAADILDYVLGLLSDDLQYTDAPVGLGISVPEPVEDEVGESGDGEDESSEEEPEQPPSSAAATAGTTSTTSTIKPSNGRPIVPVGPTDTLEGYLSGVFQAQTRALRLTHLTLGPEWSVILPIRVTYNYIGDRDSVILMLDGVDMSLHTSPVGTKFVKVYVPRDSIQGASEASWYNGTLRSVWARRMWRAWTLIWGWSDYLMKNHNEHRQLLDYLTETVKDTLEPGEVRMLNKGLQQFNEYQSQ